VILEIAGKEKRVTFGQAGAGDYTTWPDAIADKKKELYLKRHGGMGEDWKASGIATPGFWAKWLLWNKRSIEDSLADVRRRFHL